MKIRALPFPLAFTLACALVTCVELGTRALRLALSLEVWSRETEHRRERAPIREVRKRRERRAEESKKDSKAEKEKNGIKESNQIDERRPFI